MSVSTAADRSALSNNVIMGDPVEFTHYLVRRTAAFGHERRERGDRIWERAEVTDLQIALPDARRSSTLRGIIVGKRTLAEGNAEWDEGYSTFVPKSHLRAYLVAFDLKRRPVYVMASDLRSA